MEIVQLKKLRIAYERRGKGKPLVLVHGYPLDHSIWKSIMPLLENDFDLIMPDLRGFGQSGVVDGPNLMSDFAEDIATLLDYLKIDKTYIAGHSMGGYVSLAFVRKFSNRVAGLGLLASQVLPDTPEKKATRSLEADHILIHGVREVAESMSKKLTADVGLQATLKNLILRQKPEGLAGALKAIAERPDSSDLLGIMDFPVTIIHGLDDKIIPVDRAREVQNKVKRGTLWEVEETGHMPMMEAPKITADALKSFL